MGDNRGYEHAAVIDRARTRRQRPGWATSVPGRWFGRGRGLTLIAVGALLLIAGAVAAGSGLLRLPSVVPPEPAPSLGAVLPPSPGIETPTPGPTASPSPAPTEAPVPVPPKAPSWATTGDMTTPRSDFAAVPLLDGKVLVVGGRDGDKNLASAELYDPATGTWTTTGSMASHAGSFAYLGHMTATLLRDGKVLVAGGRDSNRDSLASAELYDPATGTWTATGSMLTPRAGHSVTLLSDGRVLVTGGMSGPREGDFLASSEAYDPATGTWTATGSLGTARADHTATLLSDGRVLVAGGVRSVAPDSGSGVRSAELYDLATGTWTYARSMASTYSSRAPIALPDGRVLTGGVPPQLYDPATRSWTATGGKAIAWFNGPAVLLANGGALALGAAKPGEDSPKTTAAYLFDPGAGSWTPAGTTTIHRWAFTATLLPDGRVLVAGGSDADAKDPGAGLASAELFDPGTWSPSPVAPSTPAPTPTPYPVQPAGSMFAYLRQAGRVWVANGDGTGAHELLPDLVGSPGTPAWSPDGTRLVFSMAAEGDRDGVSRLYLTDAAGSTPQLVDTGCVAPCTGDTDPAFSSDGTKLVFVRTIMVPPASTELIGGSGKAAGDREASVIATVDLSTGQVTELASTTMEDCPLLPGQKQPGVPNCGGFADHSPRWAPDGTQIVFSQDIPYDGNGPANRDINGMPPPPHWPPSAIFVVDVDGGNLHRVAQCCSSAEWSPDGARIVFDAWPRAVLTINPGRGTGYTFEDDSAVYSVAPDGTDQQRLTPDKLSGAPSFTADGRIWFARGGHLWIIDADGANASQVSGSPDESLYQTSGRPPRP